MTTIITTKQYKFLYRFIYGFLNRHVRPNSSHWKQQTLDLIILQNKKEFEGRMEQKAKMTITLLVTAILAASALVFAAPETNAVPAARATFIQSGIPDEITWAVTCLDAPHSATTPANIVVSGTNGHWTWSAGNIAGATGIQYVPNPKSGSDTGTKTINIAYSPQFQVSFTATSGGSVTTPTSPQWYNKDASGIAIAAVANTGYHFISWTTTGSITVSAPSSASTTITVNGPGTVTANFALSTPIIESSDGAATEVDEFTPVNTVYTYGSGFTESTNLNIYVVDHKDTWTIGDTLTDVRSSPTASATDSSGTLAVTQLWVNPSPGKYDIIADANNNGQYDANEAIDSADVTINGTTGFFVLPEYTLGGLGALCALFGAFGVIKVRSNRKHN